MSATSSLPKLRQSKSPDKHIFARNLFHFSECMLEFFNFLPFVDEYEASNSTYRTSLSSDDDTQNLNHFSNSTSFESPKANTGTGASAAQEGRNVT